MSAERPHSQAKTIHLFAYVQPTDPGMIGAKKGWVDTSLDPPVLKVRNSANDGWITVGAAGGSGGGSGSGHTIYDEDELTQRDVLWLEGSPIIGYDDPVELRTVLRVMSTGIATAGDPEDPSMIIVDGTFLMVEFYNG